MAATKTQYLRQLNRLLRRRLADREMINDMLADYEGFFAGGAKEGRTEAELCATYGPPKETARALSRAEGCSGKPVALLAPAFFVLSVLLNNVILPGTLLCLGNIFVPYIAFEVPSCAWLTAFLTPLLWFLWRNTPRAAPEEQERRGPVLLCAAALLLWLAALVPVRLLLLQRQRGEEWSLFGAFSSGLFQILCWIEFALAAALLFSLLRAWRKSVWYLVPAACCQGFLTGICRFFDAGGVSPSVFPMLCGFADALLCAALTVWLIRHGNEAVERLRTAMRLDGGEQNRRRFTLLLLWPVVALWMSRAIGRTFDWSEYLPLIAAPVLLPLLCLLWRGVPKGSGLTAKGRWEMVLLCALPLLLLFAHAGLCVFEITAFAMNRRISVVPVLCDSYVVNSLLAAVVLVAALWKSWTVSDCFLFPAAHCVGVITAIGSFQLALSHVDATPPVQAGPLAVFLLRAAVTPYTLSWLGTGFVFLTQRLGRHYGRTA